MITVERKHLADAVHKAVAALPKMTSLPVLNGLRIAPVGVSAVEVTGSNLDFTVTVCRNATNTADQAPLVVPARFLDAFLKGAAGDTVTITEGDDHASVDLTCGRAEINLRSFDATTWPDIAEADGDGVVLEVEQLARLRRAIHAASTDPSATDWKGGVGFDGTYAMTRDSYRAVVADLGLDVPTVVVPVGSLVAVLRDADGPVRMTSAGNLVTFATASTTWTTNTIAVDYPKTVEQVVVPALAVKGRLTFDADAMDEALGRMLIFSGTVSLDGNLGNAVVSHATIHRDGDVLRLHNSRLDFGDITDEVACSGDWTETFRVDIGFLRQLLRSHGEPSVTLEMTTASGAMFAHGDHVHQALQLVKIPASQMAGAA